MPASPHDKRKQIRFLIAIPLKYLKVRVEDLRSSCTHDISGGGLGLITSEPLPENTPVALCLKLPDNGEEILLEAEVVWSMPIDGSKYRSGLKLKNNHLKPIPLVLRTIYSKL